MAGRASIAAMPASSASHDLTRTTLAVLLLVGLMASVFWILRPFLAPLIWSALLVIACWPAFLWLQQRLGNRRWAAIAVMMLLLLLLVVVPVTLILGALIQNAPELTQWAHDLLQHGLPPAPDWVATLPLVGERVASWWNGLAGPAGLTAQIEPYATDLAGWFVATAGNAGLLAFHYLLTVVFAGVLFAKGEAFAAVTRRFARRLAGERGDQVAVLASQGVRAVAIGVVVTALVQALVGGLGVAVAGLPVPGILTAIMFLGSLAQVGAAPVLALAAVWLFLHDSPGWGIAMIGWTVLVGSLDNVIRPLVIRQGIDLPLALLFLGVIGGLIAFGPLGLFIGPVVLAVGYTLLRAWIDEGKTAGAPQTS